MISKKLYDSGVINKNSVKSWIIENCFYEVRSGSFSYGVSTDNSDIDIIGVTLPTKEITFPHLSGVISGFGNQGEKFESFQAHHTKDKNEDKEYDITIYSIVKYFDLCMRNNPNMIDSLFVNEKCITHISDIGRHMVENRDIFLHKGCWHTFKGYAYSQKNKMLTKNPIGKRKESYEKFKYDLKFAYHLVRLLLEVEQILTEGTLTLDRNSYQLRSIRSGEWTLDEILSFFDSKEKCLESVYNECKILPYSPDEGKIKKLLMECLEIGYGNIENYTSYINNCDAHNLICEIENVIRKYK